MSISEKDIYWMQRALELARRGIGVTSPNPAVGCVILDRAGQGRRRGLARIRPARPRRSRLSGLHQAGSARAAAPPTSRSSPATTPAAPAPCTEALIAPELAASSPPPSIPIRCCWSRHGGLRAAGLQTHLGVCEAEARRINEGFARWIQHKRPFVLMKVAMTLDGRIAPPPGHQTPANLTGSPAKARVPPSSPCAGKPMPHSPASTPSSPTIAMLTDRRGLRRRRPLLRVVFDSALRMPLDAKMVRAVQNDVVVFTVSKDEARINELRNRGIRIEVLPGRSRSCSVGQAIRQIRRRRHPHRPHRNRHPSEHCPARQRNGRPRASFRCPADHGL